MFNPTLVAFLAAAMLRWSHPNYYPSEQGILVRYSGIAEDALVAAFEAPEAAFDPPHPPLFTGPSARVETAMLYLAIASYESGGFRAGVDLGSERGDGGKSWCLMQVNIGQQRIVVLPNGLFRYGKPGAREGWSGRDLVKDRKKCFWAAGAIARESLRRCGDLSGYTTGSCWPGEREATLRIGRGRALARTAWWLDSDAR